MSANIKINIVEPGTPPSPTPTPVDPSTTGTTDISVPDTGLFTHGIGGTEATIITISTIALLLTIIATIVTVLYKKHIKQGKVTKLVRTIEQTKTIIKSKKRISSALSAIALLASVGTLAILLANSNKTNTNAMEGGTELTVDVNSEDLTIEVGDSPVFAYLPVELTVEEATQTGYTLSAYAEDTNLVSTTDESNIIPMVAINEEDLSEYTSLTDNTWGLSLTEPQDQNSEVYTTLSTDQSSPTILKTIDDYSETNANDKTIIYYGFYITPDTPKGTYEGSNITYAALTNPPVATVTFDGNGLYFNNDEEQTTNTIKYIPNVPISQTVAYSHTPNVNDEGVQTSGEMYPIGLNKTFVYKFENATEVKLHLVKMEPDGTCGPNSDQYFSFWEGSHPDYTAKDNWGSGVKVSGSDGKYPFYSGQYVGMDATVQGDTLTLAYTTSDRRGGSCGNSGYGYYATITATDANGNDAPIVGNDAVVGNYAKPTTEATHKFLGWSTDKNALIGTYTSAKDFTNYVFNSPDEKVTMYAIWDPIIEIIYNGNGADSTTDMNNVSQYTTDFTTAGRTVDLLASNYQRAGYGFIGWSEDKDAYTKLVNGEDVTIYGPNETLTIGREMQQRMSQTGGLELNAIWAEVAKDSQGNDLTFQTDNLLTTKLADGTTLAAKSNGYVTALKDERDNEVYAVAKLADGNYWMIENLRLDNSSELSLQNANNPSLPLTNDYNAGTTSNFLSATSNSWCTDWGNAPCYNQSKLNTNNVAATTASPSFSNNYTGGTHNDNFNANLYSYGNYYNWYSATAGNGKQETGSNQIAAGDICPAGWQLPYGGSGDTNNGKGNTSGGFYYLNNLLGNSSNAWRSFPNNFIYSGYWNGSSPNSRGSNGYYWSSTAGDTSNAYYLYLYNSYVSFYSNNKYYGSSVRCVAPIQTTITFDGNGNDGGEMAKQGISPNTTAPLSQNKFIKDGYVFVSWNTERDGSGASYTDGQDFTAGEGINKVTLYAQWEEIVVIGDLIYMQDFAVLSEIDKTSVLYSMAEGQQYQLKDSRDQKDYYISKLADGNVWMTQNLDLELDSTKIYTPSDTDIFANWTPVRNTATDATWDASATGKTSPYSYDPGDLYWDNILNNSYYNNLDNGTVTDPFATSGGVHFHVGNYYNWTAAVAMNDSSSYTSQYTDVNQSICPAGWRLPTYSGDKSYLNLKNTQNFTSGTSGNIQDDPTYFVYGGDWNGQSSIVGRSGQYWSSVVYTARLSYTLGFHAYGEMNPQGNMNREFGYSLRCVAR